MPNDFELVRFDYDPLGGNAVYTVDGRVYKVLIGKEKRTIIIR